MLPLALLTTFLAAPPTKTDQASLDGLRTVGPRVKRARRTNPELRYAGVVVTAAVARELEADRAEAVDVGGGGERRAAQLLRRHVQRGARDGAGAGGQRACQAQIDQPHRAVGLAHDVVGLEVAVHVARGRELRQRRRQPGQPRHHLVERDRPGGGGQRVAQRHAGDPRHREVRATVGEHAVGQPRGHRRRADRPQRRLQLLSLIHI